MWKPIARTAAKKEIEAVDQGMGRHYPLLNRPLNLHPCAPPALITFHPPKYIEAFLSKHVLIFTNSGMMTGSPNINYEEL